MMVLKGLSGAAVRVRGAGLGSPAGTRRCRGRSWSTVAKPGQRQVPGPATLGLCSSTEGPAHLCPQPAHPLLSLLPPPWLGSPPLHPTQGCSWSAWGAGGGPGVSERPLRSPVSEKRLFGCPRGAARACQGVGAAAHWAAPGGCRAPQRSPPGPTGSRSAGGQALVAGHDTETQGGRGGGRLCCPGLGGFTTMSPQPPLPPPK